MNKIVVETSEEVQINLGQELHYLEKDLIVIYEGHRMILPAGLVVIIVNDNPLTLEDSDANEYIVVEGFPTL